MKIGLTYDLREDYRALGYSEDEVAEFDRADTIDSLEDALAAMGHESVRIGHLRALVGRLAAGERWDLVFNIAEGMYGVGREATIPALLDAYQIPAVFSDPLVLALTLHKGMTKRVLRDGGLPTCDFAVVEREEEVDALRLAYPLFAKPVAEGSSKGVSARSKVGNLRELRDTVADLLARFHQPVLVETFLPGREFTVGILGTGERARSIGALEVELNASAEAEVYSYANKEDCEIHVSYVLKHDAMARQSEELALRAWRLLGCRDGGRVDLRADAAGQLQLVEVNPLPGLHPEHSDLPILATQAGISYHQLIAEIVSSALQRIELAQPCGS